MHSIHAVFSTLIEWLIIDIPGGLGRRLRYRYYRRRLKHIGQRVYVDGGVRFIHPELISIGENCWIDQNVLIIAGQIDGKGACLTRKVPSGFPGGDGEVRIGDNCHIAPSVIVQGHGGVWIGDNITVAAGTKLYSLSHYYSNPNDPSDQTVYKFTGMVPLQEQSLISSPIWLEDNTAVGLNSVLLPGATVRRNSWVGACSLVTGEIEPDVIAFGQPARPVKLRSVAGREV